MAGHPVKPSEWRQDGLGAAAIRFGCEEASGWAAGPRAAPAAAMPTCPEPLPETDGTTGQPLRQGATGKAVQAKVNG